MRVVTDAGPLIHLSWVDHLALLPHLFGTIHVPEAVHDEVLRADIRITGVPELRHCFDAGWCMVQRVESVNAALELGSRLDRGESEAIVLAVDMNADLLLIDDRAARAVAERFGLRTMGTLGILRIARDAGAVSNLVEIVEKLRGDGMYISDALLDAIRSGDTGG